MLNRDIRSFHFPGNFSVSILSRARRFVRVSSFSTLAM